MLKYPPFCKTFISTPGWPQLDMSHSSLDAKSRVEDSSVVAVYSSP